MQQLIVYISIIIVDTIIYAGIFNSKREKEKQANKHAKNNEQKKEREQANKHAKKNRTKKKRASKQT